jgi:flagellin
VEAQSSSLGSTQANVASQQTFVNNLATQFTSGAGAMVDANMTAESARLTALQTQQSLGISALSIANQAPQSVLKLFG